jgi:SAM-dependent methyltransferase
MAQYEKLAEIYDYLVAGVDYEDWLDYIEKILDRYGYRADKVVDLACGTGNTTLPFARKGYDVTGVDIAPAMLALARQKAEQEGLNAGFLEQDMRELKLPGPVDLFTCYHDGLNYITDTADLKLVLERVYHYLKPGGLFIFDLVVVNKLKGAGGDTTFFDDNDLSLVWDSSYDKEQDIWEVTLTGFVRKGDLYEKFTEVHREKHHAREEIEPLLAAVGFELLDVFHSFTLEPPNPLTRRAFYVARKPEI